jgi:putative resolvase
MKLSKWAKLQGIHYTTALRWYHEGNIPNARQLSTNTILVDENEQTTKVNERTEVDIYCRVSSYNKKDDLERQAQRCEQFCLAQGFPIRKIYKEVASGMNDDRPKLNKLLESNPRQIVVEHKDRLTRFGFNYFEILLPKLNCKLVVINRDHEEESDLIKDLVSIITSYCCRLYGIRKGQSKASKIKEVLQ